MTFHFPQKLRLTSWVTLFALAVIMFSPMAVHATATDDIQEPSAAEISIDNLN
ncbi:hypothetical protein HKB22_02090, partial [Vibrio parahaemolyticus]|nr:hypothetical protein [Vibrio parahaemolyticus]